MTTKRNYRFSLLKTVELQEAPLWKGAPVNSRTFFVCFPGSLFSFEQTGLFPAHLFCISRTCSRSPERLDCMPLHLLTRSCTSRLFTAKARQSPEIPRRRICAAPEDLFRRWAFRSAPALGFRKWQRNLSARRESNGAAAFEHQSQRPTSLIRHVAFLSPAAFGAAASISAAAANFAVDRLGSAPAPALLHSGRVARGRMMPEVSPRRNRALVTPQLDFGFHKASPLFTLTGCAGY